MREAEKGNDSSGCYNDWNERLYGVLGADRSRDSRCHKDWNGAFMVLGADKVVIPDSVTRIARCRFYGCSGLTEVTIPAGVTKIGNTLFVGALG